jgi:hypothetical protein
VAELRISDQSSARGGPRQVQVTWQDGPSRRMAVAEFTGVPGDGDDDDGIRWYLEDYADFPEEPGPARAQAAERQLAQIGADLFTRVFSDPDAADIWAQASDRLGEVRIEVDADPGAGPGPAWELLRDPRRDAAVALAAGTFVRTHLRAAAHPALPVPAGDHLRVLLVICRPSGGEDVPFRSVASRLIRGGAAQMEGLDLDVLRPPTYARLSEVLHAARDKGNPYHVVHLGSPVIPRSLAVPSASAFRPGDQEAPANQADARGEDQPWQQHQQVSTGHLRLPRGSGPSVGGMLSSQRAGTHLR